MINCFFFKSNRQINNRFLLEFMFRMCVKKLNVNFFFLPMPHSMWDIFSKFSPDTEFTIKWMSFVRCIIILLWHKLATHSNVSIFLHSYKCFYRTKWRLLGRIWKGQISFWCENSMSVYWFIYQVLKSGLCR